MTLWKLESSFEVVVSNEASLGASELALAEREDQHPASMAGTEALVAGVYRQRCKQ